MNAPPPPPGTPPPPPPPPSGVFQPKRQPVDVEKLLAQREAEKAASGKFKFMNKAERERLKREKEEKAKYRNTSKFSAEKKRKRMREPKFKFDWDLTEDTSAVNDPLYANHTAANGGIKEGPAQSKKSRYNDVGKHWSEKTLDEMKPRDWRYVKENFNISTTGGSVPNPMRCWEESGLPQRLLNIVEQVGYTEPSPVQRAAIPIALQNRDLIAVASTGSGKTAAFLLPLLVYISELPTLDEDTRYDGPYAIILAPTRELAQQIELEAKKFATPMGFNCVSLVGGHSIESQIYNMRDGAEIIIATPGRLVDCIERRVLVLNQCCYIIMDEADRMIDMGFEEPVNKILEALPVSNEKLDTEDAEDGLKMAQQIGGRDRYRQTMMYTATMPAAVERIAKRYLRRPATVRIGADEAASTVEQKVEFINGEDRRKRRLEEILNSGNYAPPIIVFVNVKRSCDGIARDIQKMGFSCVSLHGSKTQDQREAALASLRNGQTDVLVATDLAGRGIDVPNVSLVINFTMAGNIEAYTHRIGRTGRAGKEGTAITFLGDEDIDVLPDLKLLISRSASSKVSEELERHESAAQRKRLARAV
ncbi:DEAD-domain-containing protein [Piedraia hortae CBS 480.64]|uniref:RNA helicase n=1 Tax=Piedraia hortae CBS 480.64 TaxID=1314780 RepID=A0A6A7BSR6_9PEZI|nr:DEAD-domain-containing protein [Piedraia hortae CBS 480.64]